ncbi:flagellar biosynthetic protein FliR [Salicibibacter kimchii]|uniref:Flagellar biosynthetic protein FliR n=1 Tax=Salicibibacter kimchii TaxID=2099786 RepID=A0A345BVY9_9BACI|nr:flagellar biosynthetic protein FliR [Salicibibacter kimchii]AXF55120.1 flagellar type III secretion system protein FliR [Salicibibacter kimchii]
MEWINQFPAFLLIFVRILAFLATLPIFSYRNVPNMYKIAFALFFAYIIFFTLDVPTMEVEATFFLLIIKEVLIGLLLGLIASILFYAIQVAGAFIDIKMGFLIANVMDPQTGAQTPLTGGFLYAFAVLFLLVTDGHHLLLDGIFYSYAYVPVDEMTVHFGGASVMETAAGAVSTMFVIAFQMSFPIVGALFLVDVALGLMSRAVPQMNVFVVGLPLKIFLGLPIMLLMLPSFFWLVSNLVDEIVVTMRTLLQLFGGA